MAGGIEEVLMPMHASMKVPPKRKGNPAAFLSLVRVNAPQ